MTTPTTTSPTAAETARKPKAKATPKPARKTAKATPKPARKTPATDGAKIRLLVKDNPHRAGSKDFAKWRKLSACRDVGAALAAKIDRGYLRYVAGRGLIAIG